jgi:hypothetical protein
MAGHTGWSRVLGADPVPWLLASGEPAAVWVARTAVLGQPADHPEVIAAHAAVRGDPCTAALIAWLPDWTAGDKLSGHQDPRFAPNQLNLLADMGMTVADDAGIGHLLGQFLAHQDQDGRFMSFGSVRSSEQPVWGALPCDAHAVTEVLVRYGYLRHAALVRPAQRADRSRPRRAEGMADARRGEAVHVRARQGIQDR